MPTLIARIGAGPEAGPHAREAMTALEPLVEPEVFDDMQLLCTELVTNAVRHGAGSRVRIEAWVLPGSVLVDVSDRGQGFEMTARKKWGLRLVSDLSDVWGAHHDGSNHVWFVLHRRPQD